MTKLGVWVVLGTSVTHVVCRHQMCILNSSFAYLFTLAITRKASIQSSIWATVMKLGWYVGGITLKYYPCVLLLSMRILSTSFAYSLKAAHAVFYEYSERVSREPRNSSCNYRFVGLTLKVTNVFPTR